VRSQGVCSIISERSARISPAVKRRDEIAVFIETYAAAHGGQSPSLQEIADALHISKTAVDTQVNKLIHEGRAKRHDGKLWLTQLPLLSEHGELCTTEP
jgi:biotin operon repressor